MSDSGERVYGIHAVQQALNNSPERVLRLHVLAGARNRRLEALIQQAERLNLTLHSTSAAALDRLCNGRHQGVLAELAQQKHLTEQDLKRDLADWQQPLLLVLDSIEDPRNLGACLRSADAAGVNGVIITRNKSAPITAVTRQTAAGAVDSLRIYPVSNLARCLEMLKQAGVWLYGTDCSESSQNLYRTDLTGAVAIVVGNEGAGLRHLTRQLCDHLVHIPQPGTVQSLNVSVATGVALFEALRQRRFSQA